MATVKSPESLRATLNEKLSRATECVFELHQAEQPEFNKYWQPAESFKDFLHAARGVVPVLKTFTDARLQPGDFEVWREKWEARLTDDAERALWLKVYAARVDQEHGDGPDLVPYSIEITRGHMPEVHAHVAVLGLKPGAWMRNPSKGGVRFAPYADRPLSEVCREYLVLCRRFVADFEHDYAHLL
jgi:hypothetical protein